MPQHVEIVENYKCWKAAFSMRATVTRLLAGVPSQHLTGLGTIVVTDTASLNRERRKSKTRSKGRTVPILKSQGLYHATTRDRPAWIELFVDNIIGHPSWPVGWLLRCAAISDLLVGEVLFHEIGHHIHTSQQPEHREREDVADEWGKRLLHAYLHSHYWYLRYLARLFSPFRARSEAYLRAVHAERARHKQSARE